MEASAQFIEKIALLQKQKKPFVAYKKPSSNALVLLWQETDHLYPFGEKYHAGFVMAPFLHHKVAYILKPDGFATYEIDPIAPPKPTVFKETNLNNAESNFHLQLVNKAVLAIKDNKFAKVVLARKEQIATKKNEATIFTQLVSTYAKAFCYWWSHPNIGSWQGATPELLMKLKNNTLETISLAGTQAYNPGTPPIWNEKELQEQALVTQDIIGSLESLGLLVKQTSVYNSKADTMWHLRTDLSAEVTTKSVFEIINALHPSPAISGYPRVAALSFIAANELLDRKFYSGYLGLVNFEISAESQQQPPTELYVNLRCMELNKLGAMLYVGSGITEDSDPILEWEETVLKTQTMRKVLEF